MGRAQKRTKNGFGFPTTQWSFIDAIRAAEGDELRDLLACFLDQYLPALDGFLRLEMAVYDENQRADMLQGFITDRVIAKAILKSAVAERGRLRSFVLRCLINYVKDQRAAKTSRQWDNTVPLDAAVMPVRQNGNIHEQVFDVLWARQVTRRALGLLQAECTEKNRPYVWIIFQRRVIEPIEKEGPSPEYAAIAQELGLTIVNVKNYLVTAKRAYQRHLRSVVDEYTIDADETEREIGHLLETLAMAASSSAYGRDGNDRRLA